VGSFLVVVVVVLLGIMMNGNGLFSLRTEEVGVITVWVALGDLYTGSFPRPNPLLYIMLPSTQNALRCGTTSPGQPCTRMVELCASSVLLVV
jgi:hypothetical protein